MSADFKCYESDDGQEYADNPETGDDFRLRDGLEGLLEQSLYARVPGFLEMMVEGGHLEDAPPGPVFAFGVFEISHLEHHREVFDIEYRAEQRQQQLLVDEALYHRNPISAPMKAAQKTESSSLPGMYIMLR